MVQFHALSLLYRARKSDRMAIYKLVSDCIQNPLKSKYALCLLIRLARSILTGDTVRYVKYLSRFASPLSDWENFGREIGVRHSTLTKYVSRIVCMIMFVPLFCLFLVLFVYILKLFFFVFFFFFAHVWMDAWIGFFVVMKWLWLFSGPLFDNQMSLHLKLLVRLCLWKTSIAILASHCQACYVCHSCHHNRLQSLPPFVFLNGWVIKLVTVDSSFSFGDCLCLDVSFSLLFAPIDHATVRKKKAIRFLSFFSLFSFFPSLTLSAFTSAP